jgi:hypothetical protein
MHEIDPRKAVVRQTNPQPSVEESRTVSREAIEERLGDLDAPDRILELGMLSDLLFNSTTELVQDPRLSTEERTALNGLVEMLDQRANRLEAGRIFNKV